MNRRDAVLIILLSAALSGFCGYQLGRRATPSSNHFTFEHRSDGIYRYDEATGEIDVLLPDKIGWQRIVAAAPASFSKKAD